MNVVLATPIISTPFIIFSAWEPANGHSTIQNDELHGWLGRVGTSPLPAKFSHLPIGSPERFEAVDRFFQDEKRRAIDIILDHEPKLIRCNRVSSDSGEICITQDERDRLDI